jgi:hypothetical protein
MNKKTTFLIFINWIFMVGSIMLVSCEKISTQSDITGIWKGNHLGLELIFKFNHDGTCSLNVKDSTSNLTEILNGNFVMDLSKKPIPLSIRNIPQLNHPLHTIVELLGSDSIRLGNFSPSWRVRDISFKQNKSIVLKRNKSK